MHQKLDTNSCFAKLRAISNLSLLKMTQIIIFSFSANTWHGNKYISKLTSCYASLLQESEPI